ncbi:sodium-translocating pyrophosphatase [Candidatus Micrarchaeota archaeon CG10_big_fil_rev_8_21_14_0_10_45_29]|nr:MAG: sodium-translocating pyrophosphatase [Candidatus Micrarchaeota archaeon CG10_big_fil_rev_8_21_14_0_10_45_29]
MYSPVVVAILALIYALFVSRKVLGADAGTQKMQEIANAIRLGANTYLKRQFSTIIIPVIVVAIFLAVFMGMYIAGSFVLGAILSSLAGYIGMYLAVRGNVRVASASKHSLNSALQMAFKAGSVNGLAVVGLGLLGVTSIFLASYFSFAAQGDKVIINMASSALIGFGFGANLLALFMRVGGGIFTKAADVGADLVGKVEANIPEDDPRNPATIADNVGDNVGDCAGMGADVFESYTVAVIAAMILGGIFAGLPGVIFPLLLHAGGIVASVIGSFVVKVNKESENPMDALNRGFWASTIIAAIIFAAIAFGMFDAQIAPKAFGATLIGLITTVLVARITEYYTGTENSPVKDIAKASQTGAGTNVISGLGIGMQSAVVLTLVIAASIGAGYWLFGFYGVALVGLGILGTTGFLMAMDTFGPIADNAGGIGEMSSIEKTAKVRLDKLDAVGNTTKALTKGFAIGSAALAAVALFSTFIEEAGIEAINLASPPVFIGLLIGACVPFLFSSLTMLSVGKAAEEIVHEVRRQFKDGKIMKGTKKPDYEKCVDISTKAAIRELVGPAVLAIGTPIAVGVIFGVEALGGFLGGAIGAGLLMAIFMSNAGGAWDNAKKLLESTGKKGSEAHMAAIVGDTVGDPFKDTSGPAINPLLKVANIVSIILAGYLAGKGLGLA